jgi:hypothetical protein
MALDLIIKLEFPKLRAKLLKSNKENKKSNAKSETQGIKSKKLAKIKEIYFLFPELNSVTIKLAH